MSEVLPKRDEVAVLFHTEDRLFIPPFEIAKEPRGPKESREKTFYRLSGAHGVIGYVGGHDTRFRVCDDEREIHGYLMKPRYQELDHELNEFAIPFDDVPAHLEQESGLQLQAPIDKRLVLAAYDLLTFNR